MHTFLCQLPRYTINSYSAVRQMHGSVVFYYSVPIYDAFLHNSNITTET